MKNESVKQKLKIEYATLSNVMDYFPKNSSHKAAQAIGIRMEEILQELDKPISDKPEEFKVVKVFNPYPKTLKDADGYPTQEALDYLMNWWYGEKDGVWYEGEFAILNKENIAALGVYLNKIWHFADWGFKFNDIFKKMELHTGGWGGNELIMTYLEPTWMHRQFWSVKKKGGHYYYEW